MLWLKKVKADEDQGGYFMVKKLVVCCLDILGYSRKVECSKDDEFFMENLHEMIRELEEEIKKSEEYSGVPYSLASSTASHPPMVRCPCAFICNDSDCLIQQPLPLLFLFGKRRQRHS